MSVFAPERLPQDPERSVAVRDARLTIQTVKAMLALSVFELNGPVAILAKMATDQALPARERRNAAGTLATVQLRLLELQASLSGAREQALSDLGLGSTTGTAAISLTQVNQVNKIEITRDADWRDAATSDDRE